MSLTQRILVAMGLGIGLGAMLQWLALPQDHFVTSVLLNGFIDGGWVESSFPMLKMLVVPLVFVSLVCGAASLGDSGAVGAAWAGKTIGLYLLTTGLAVSLAMLIALTTDPGLSSTDLKEEGVTESFQPKQAPSIKDTLLNIVPSNPIAAMADGQMLQVIPVRPVAGARPEQGRRQVAQGCEVSSQTLTK